MAFLIRSLKKKDSIVAKSLHAAKIQATLRGYGRYERVWIMDSTGTCLCFKDADEPWQAARYYINYIP